MQPLLSLADATARTRAELLRVCARVEGDTANGARTFSPRPHACAVALRRAMRLLLIPAVAHERVAALWAGLWLQSSFRVGSCRKRLHAFLQAGFPAALLGGGHIRSHWGAVAGLLGACCPPAVLGRVRTIVVDALKCHASRPGLQIADESLNIVPAFGHCDSASAVPFEHRVLRVVTAAHHLAPHGVERVTAEAMCLSHMPEFYHAA